MIALFSLNCAVIAWAEKFPEQIIIEFRISKATRSNSADQHPAADLPLLQGEGRGEDGLVQRPLNTHPHLNPPLEGEETYFRSWGKKTSYCITFAAVNKESNSTQNGKDISRKGAKLAKKC